MVNTLGKDIVSCVACFLKGGNSMNLKIDPNGSEIAKLIHQFAQGKKSVEDLKKFETKYSEQLQVEIERSGKPIMRLF